MAGTRQVALREWCWTLGMAFLTSWRSMKVGVYTCDELEPLAVLLGGNRLCLGTIEYSKEGVTCELQATPPEIELSFIHQSVLSQCIRVVQSKALSSRTPSAGSTSEVSTLPLVYPIYCRKGASRLRCQKCVRPRTLLCNRVCVCVCPLMRVSTRAYIGASLIQPTFSDVLHLICD